MLTFTCLYSNDLLDISVHMRAYVAEICHWLEHRIDGVRGSYETLSKGTSINL